MAHLTYYPWWSWPVGVGLALLAGAIWGYIAGRYAQREQRYRAAHTRAAMAATHIMPAVVSPSTGRAVPPLADRELARRVRQAAALASTRRRPS